MHKQLIGDQTPPLFTMGIAAYNNYQYLREAVDSILSQTYPNIEIIISNDGSQDFNVEEITDYIEQNKQENIKNVFIHNHAFNQGTVKSVNYICNQAKGDYIIFMAADDVLDHETVIECFVESFQNENADAYVVCARTALCGKKVAKIKDYFPNQYYINLIKTKDCKKLLSRLSYDMFLPTTSTCYKKEIFDILGPHDENCFIIEDFTFALTMLLNGYHVGWIDDFVAARHRGGGVSHGNKRVNVESLRRYRYDEVYVYMNYCLPNEHLLLPEDRKTMREKWKFVLGAYIHDFLFPEGGFGADYRDYDEELCRKIVAHREQMKRREKITEFCDISIKAPLIRIFELLLGIWLVVLAMIFAASLPVVAKVIPVFWYQNVLCFMAEIILAALIAGIAWYAARIMMKLIYEVYYSFFDKEDDFL